MNGLQRREGGDRESSNGERTDGGNGLDGANRAGKEQTELGLSGVWPGQQEPLHVAKEGCDTGQTGGRGFRQLWVHRRGVSRQAEEAADEVGGSWGMDET